tara:strand:- start:31 stop:756 length:726 start_codon:yes stop_codon:yes gene_type:complete
MDIYKALNITPKQLTYLYAKIKRVLKKDIESGGRYKYNPKLFQYLITNKSDTNNYLSGNFSLMLNHIDELLKDTYEFKFSLVSFGGLVERYLIIHNHIKTDTHNFYCIENYHNELSGEYDYQRVKITEYELGSGYNIFHYKREVDNMVDTNNIFIKKKRLNFTRLGKKFTEYWYNADALSQFLTKKYKLENTYWDTGNTLSNILETEDMTIQSIRKLLIQPLKVIKNPNFKFISSNLLLST